MHTKTLIISIIYGALIALIIWQQVMYTNLKEQYEEEKIIFNGHYGEVVRLKDDLGAYADSLRLLRRDLYRYQDSLQKLR